MQVDEESVQHHPWRRIVRLQVVQQQVSEISRVLSASIAAKTEMCPCCWLQKTICRVDVTQRTEDVAAAYSNQLIFIHPPTRQRRRGPVATSPIRGVEH